MPDAIFFQHPSTAHTSGIFHQPDQRQLDTTTASRATVSKENINPGGKVYTGSFHFNPSMQLAPVHGAAKPFIPQLLQHPPVQIQLPQFPLPKHAVQQFVQGSNPEEGPRDQSIDGFSANSDPRPELYPVEQLLHKIDNDTIENDYQFIQELGRGEQGPLLKIE